MSSIVDYFTSGIKDTYKQTVDFWSSDNKLSRTVDAVSFTIDNPQLMVDTAKKDFNKSVSELNTAVTQDRNKMIILVALAGTAYYYFQKGGK